MFADVELIGIPHRIVVGDRGLKENTVEYQGRTETKAHPVSVTEAVQFIRSKLNLG